MTRRRDTGRHSLHSMERGRSGGSFQSKKAQQELPASTRIATP